MCVFVHACSCVCGELGQTNHDPAVCFQTSASKMFEALHDFSSMEEGELNFKKGDRIRLLEKTDENWWTGVVVGTNQEGLFPINYVKELKSH